MRQNILWVKFSLNARVLSPSARIKYDGKEGCRANKTITLNNTNHHSAQLPLLSQPHTRQNGKHKTGSNIIPVQMADANLQAHKKPAEEPCLDSSSQQNTWETRRTRYMALFAVHHFCRVSPFFYIICQLFKQMSALIAHTIPAVYVILSSRIRTL